jgi:hypothetical protein
MHHQEFGICLLNVIPVREFPKHAAQQITQLIFGECYQILENNGKWLRIESLVDQYQGWIDYKQFTFLSEKEKTCFQEAGFSLNTDKKAFVTGKHGNERPLNVGSIIPNDSSILKAKHVGLKAPGESFNHTDSRIKILQFAHLFLDTPYLWGGRSYFGIDCSAFVQLAYLSIGISLPRDSTPQSKCGRAIELADTLPGDLAFFAEAEKLDHVGFVLEDSKVLHASGKVRIDLIDSKGIYNEERSVYTHQIRSCRRILDN